MIKSKRLTISDLLELSNEMKTSCDIVLLGGLNRVCLKLGKNFIRVNGLIVHDTKEELIHRILRDKNVYHSEQNFLLQDEVTDITILCSFSNKEELDYITAEYRI